MPKPSSPAPRNYRAVLRRVVELTPSTMHFEWEVVEGGRFEFLAGQFISMTLEHNGQVHTRAYSVASAPHGDARFDLCLNRVPGGLFSNYLCDLVPGATIGFHGPYGFFTVQRPVEHDLAFVATDTGIAPIRGLLADLFARESELDREIWLLFGVDTPAMLLYGSEFAAWAAEHSNFHFVPTLSHPPEGWRGRSGEVQQQLRQLFTGRRDFFAYVCGLKAMVDDVRRILKEEFQLDRKQIRYEKYD
jgi:NAD(P)H-flavin reductase